MVLAKHRVSYIFIFGMLFCSSCHWNLACIFTYSEILHPLFTQCCDKPDLGAVRYCIEEDWREQVAKIQIYCILKPSNMDQVCIKLMHPPDLSQSGNQASFKKALYTLGVDQQTAGEIISIFFLKTMDNDVAIELTNIMIWNWFYSWQTGQKLYNCKWFWEVQHLRS